MQLKKTHWTFIVATVGYSLSFMAFLAVMLFVRLKGLDKHVADALFLYGAAAGCIILGVGIWAGLRRYYGRFPGEPLIEQDKAITVLVTSLAVFTWAAILLLSMLVTGFLMFHGLASPALAALIVLVAISGWQLVLLNLFRKFVGTVD
jgi:hypothetical protein